jgi:hypothetical protein
MNFKVLTAATVLTAAIASPALAMGPHARSEAALQHNEHVYRNAHAYRSGGFWPGDLAAGVVGGAIGTAGAIVSAPFAYDNYAYNGYGPYGYANGFACQPGTTFVGEDGLRHICQ